MKVVLFCGGMGTRLRDYSDAVPKPMVPIGHRPVLWHVMRYYAHFGHTDFILCLGYKGDVIKDYFLNYSEAVSNDFVLSRGGRDLKLLNSDIDDWTITFVDTGLNTSIAERLLAIRDHLDDGPFLANYADGVTDLPLPDLIAQSEENPEVVATFMTVPPPLSFHVAEFSDEGLVNSVHPIKNSGVWVNAGYFVFRPEIFDYVKTGDDLAVDSFQRIADDSRLLAYPYNGYWAVMDTFKDKQALDDLYEKGPAPWEIWKHAPSADPEIG